MTQVTQVLIITVPVLGAVIITLIIAITMNKPVNPNEDLKDIERFIKDEIKRQIINMMK